MLSLAHQAYGSALPLALAYGFLHVVGPDHLGTVMALSVAVPPRQAFYVGASWALGHCAGMVVIAAIVIILQRVTRVSVETWEHLGDYIIGFSMVAVAMYFILRESQYVVEQSDGSTSIRPCACHSHSTITRQRPRRSHKEQGGKKLRFAEAFNGTCQTTPAAGDVERPFDEQMLASAHTKGEELHCCDIPIPSEEDPLIPKLEISEGQNAAAWSEVDSSHSLQGALLGVLQGMCCPMGLMGVVFLASLPTPAVAAFIIVFIVVSAVGTGILASSWSWLTSNEYVNANIPSRVLYRGSCIFTLLLGVAWIVANYYGVLDRLNYAEGQNELQLPALAHVSTAHGGSLVVLSTKFK